VKDHEKRELVNRLTKIASEYAHTQQLRERIAHELLSSIESDSSFAAQAAAWRSLVEWICTATTTVDMPDLALPIGITYNTLRTYFERARRDIGMPGLWFHDLRHTAASWWIASGASLAVVRDLLGHSNISVTSRYLHLMTGDLKRASDNLGAITGGSCTKNAQNGASD